MLYLVIGGLLVLVVVVLACGICPPSSIPGPFWVLPLIQENIEFTSDLMMFFIRRRIKHGPIFRAYIFGHCFVVIGDWRLAKKVFTAKQVNWALPIDSVRSLMQPNSFRSSENKLFHPTFRKFMSQACNDPYPPIPYPLTPIPIPL